MINTLYFLFISRRFSQISQIFFCVNPCNLWEGLYLIYQLSVDSYQAGLILSLNSTSVSHLISKLSVISCQLSGWVEMILSLNSTSVSYLISKLSVISCQLTVIRLG